MCVCVCVCVHNPPVSVLTVVYGSAITPNPHEYPSLPSVRPSNCREPFRYASPKARLRARRPPVRHVPPTYLTHTHTHTHRHGGVFHRGQLASILLQAHCYAH